MGGIGLDVPLPLAGRVGFGRIMYSCPTSFLMVSSPSQPDRHGCKGRLSYGHHT